MQNHASANADITFELMLFHGYYTTGDSKKEIHARRNKLREVDAKVATAMMNFINAPAGDDDVSKKRRVHATREYIAAFTEMRQRLAQKRSAKQPEIEHVPQAAAG